VYHTLRRNKECFVTSLDKAKKNFSLEQARKAQKWRRGIALLFP
jgi:hypothetical protein